MTDPGDDGQAVGDEGANHPFVVERPQVLERSAAAGEDRQLGGILRAPIAVERSQAS